MGDFTRIRILLGGLSDCEELVWDEFQLPVQSDMHTFLAKKLSRPGMQFPGNCMDNAYKFAYTWTFEKVAHKQTLGNAGGSAGSRTPDHLIKSQMLYQLSYRPAMGDTQEYQKSNKCQLY